MTSHFKKSALAAVALAVMGAAGFIAAPQAEARGITVALANSFTTLDPYPTTPRTSFHVRCRNPFTKGSSYLTRT